MARLIPPPDPGETILEDILKPLDMSVNQLAKHLGVTATRLNEIVHGRRGVTADTALRLARYLGHPPNSGLACSSSTISAQRSKKRAHRLRGR